MKGLKYENNDLKLLEDDGEYIFRQQDSIDW